MKDFRHSPIRTHRARPGARTIFVHGVDTSPLGHQQEGQLGVSFHSSTVQRGDTYEEAVEEQEAQGGGNANTRGR